MGEAIDLNVFVAQTLGLILTEAKKLESVEWIIDMSDDVLATLYSEGKVDKATACKHRTALHTEAERCTNLYGFARAWKNACPALKPILGYVYAIEDSSGMVKIGRSINPKSRINSIRTQSGKTFTQTYISAPMSGYGDAELDTHKAFSQHRTHGEWFKTSFGAVTDYIDKLAKARVEVFAEVIGKTLIPSAQLQIESKGE